MEGLVVHASRRLVLFLSLLAAGMAQAAELQRPVARASIASDGVRFEPLVAAQDWSLSVSGPSGFSAQSTAAYPPTISTFDAKGSPLPDGVYQFELRAGAPPLLSQALGDQAGDNADQATARAQGRSQSPEGPVSPGLPALSGVFTVAGGAIIVASGPEPQTARGIAWSATSSRVAAPDVVNADDLIVQGSLCVGLDCVNNESFGFDTIRMKENNTRIKFEDTSATAGFPANQWQLTANDSASGGANKFAIDDVTGGLTPFTVTAGAPTNGFFMASSGKVGFRTSAPGLDLHVTTSDTPAFRMEQTNAGGFTAQTWDIGANEANFFVRDMTGGSLLPFRIRPGAPTSSIDIAASGNVGIGTANAAGALHTKRSGNVLSIVESSDNNAVQLRLKSDNTNRRLIALNSADAVQSQIVLGDSGEFQFLGATTGLLRGTLNSTGLSLPGTLSAASSSVTGAASAASMTAGSMTAGSISAGASIFTGLTINGPLSMNTTGNVIPVFQSSDNNAVQLRLKTNSANRRLIALNSSDAVQSQIVLGDSGDFSFLGATVSDTRATLNSTGLNVNGSISVRGTVVHPDYVFEPTYRLLSMEEQAAYMRDRRHLPAVGAGTYDAEGRSILDIGVKTLGILEELEKAHLYIDQLNRRIQALESRLASAPGTPEVDK
jgi:hypothetical protein